MSVTSWDRAQKVKHRFTIYQHGENPTNENQSTEPSGLSDLQRRRTRTSSWYRTHQEEPTKDTPSPKSHAM